MTSSKLVKAAYSIELAPGEFKPEPHRHHGNRANEYKAVKKLDLTTKDSRGVRLHRAQRGPRSRDDLRVSQRPKKTT